MNGAVTKMVSHKQEHFRLVRQDKIILFSLLFANTIFLFSLLRDIKSIFPDDNFQQVQVHFYVKTSVVFIINCKIILKNTWFRHY